MTIKVGVRSTLRGEPGVIATPLRSTPGAAGHDLYAAEGVALAPGTITLIDTGIALQIPPGWLGLIRDRSGLGVRGVSTRAGVIDSDYRGSVGVVVVNESGGTHIVHAGDRIAQLLFLPVPEVEFVSWSEADAETERGAGGFGSTGS